MSTPQQLFIDSKKAKNFSGHHPWVLEKSVVAPAVPLATGQIVDLMTTGGGWVGRGVYNANSRIRVRLYLWDRNTELDQAWVLGKLRRAVELRETWMMRNQPLDALRLVNSEGDGLSGLIVDKFGDYLVVQVTAFAMTEWLDGVLDWLQEHFTPQGILVRIDEKTARNEGLEASETFARGTPPEAPLSIAENGVKLTIDLTSGQKTGYYLDQRANRLTAAKWIPAGPMLDVCCYLGGFSLAAAREGKATSIMAVDSSMRALEQADANAKLNGFEDIDFVQADCFDYLEQLVSEEKKFQSIVLDPPRMASNRGQVSAALRAYYRLNLSAVNLLESGGMLITCSCSGRVTRSDFFGMLASVAKRTRRPIQVVETHGADFDHPVDVNCPETEYLKFFVCRVG